MAEVKIEISSDLKEKLDKALDFLEKKQFRRLMNRIGQIVKSNTQERISNSGPAPDGAPWADNNRPNNILLDTGALRGSIKFEASLDDVEIGTDLIYGATHQFGDPSRNIKERPYLGLSSDDERDILEEIDAFLQREIG